MLLSVKLQAEVCNFTKSDIPPWVFFTFYKLHEWYQNTQSVKGKDRTIEPIIMSRKKVELLNQCLIYIDISFRRGFVLTKKLPYNSKV